MGANQHRGAFLFGMLAGAVAGAAVTLLKTPVSGQELRQRLRRKAEQIVPGGKLPSVSPEMQDRIRDTSRQLRSRASSAAASAQSRSREALTTGRGMALNAGTGAQSRSREALAIGRVKAGAATATVTQRVQQIRNARTPELDGSGHPARYSIDPAASLSSELLDRTGRVPGEDRGDDH